VGLGASARRDRLCSLEVLARIRERSDRGTGDEAIGVLLVVCPGAGERLVAVAGAARRHAGRAAGRAVRALLKDARLRRQPVGRRQRAPADRGSVPRVSAVLPGAVLERAGVVRDHGRAARGRGPECVAVGRDVLRLRRRRDRLRAVLELHAQPGQPDRRAPQRPAGPRGPVDRRLGRGERLPRRRSDRPGRARCQPGRARHDAGGGRGRGLPRAEPSAAGEDSGPSRAAQRSRHGSAQHPVQHAAGGGDGRPRRGPGDHGPSDGRAGDAGGGAGPAGGLRVRQRHGPGPRGRHARAERRGVSLLGRGPPHRRGARSAGRHDRAVVPRRHRRRRPGQRGRLPHPEGPPRQRF